MHGTAITLARPVSSQGPTRDSLAAWPSVPGDGTVLPGVAHTYEDRLHGSSSSHHPLGWGGQQKFLTSNWAHTPLARASPMDSRISSLREDRRSPSCHPAAR